MATSQRQRQDANPGAVQVAGPSSSSSGASSQQQSGDKRLKREIAEAEDKNDEKSSDEIVPKSTDEPAVVCMLSGYSIASCVEMCGWSRQVPLSFPLRTNLKIKDMCNAQGEILPCVRDHENVRFTLYEMSEVAGRGKKAFHPVYVKVLAKKKIDSFVFNGKLLIITLLVIADESGYCVLCSFNEAVQTIYNEVDVGDQLLISFCMPQKPKRTYHKGLFSDGMFLDLELKIQYHSVLAHYRRKFDPMKANTFKFPEELFNADHLKLPCEMQAELKKLDVNSEFPAVGASLEMQYTDLVGVISYVSRIERYTTGSDQVECKVDNQNQVVPLCQYILYRYVCLVDKTSKPLKVKLKNIPPEQHRELIPGAIIVISHCCITEKRHVVPYCEDSYFSSIYIGPTIEKYFKLHPPKFKQKLAEVISHQNYTSIISRKDLCWSVGGMLPTRIMSDDLFHQFFYTERVGPDLPTLARRESVRLYFSGVIHRALTASADECQRLHYANKRYTELDRRRRNSEFKLINHYLTHDCNKNVSWYSYIRKLPPVSDRVLNLPTVREIVKEVTEEYKDYCGPLLVPAEVPAGKYPSLAGLERVDGPPFVLLDIINEEQLRWYKCIWKTCSEYTVEEMIKKVDFAKDKQIICSAEVFCSEENVPIEFVLHDFVVDGTRD